MREPSPDSVWRDRDFVRYWAGQIMAITPAGLLGRVDAVVRLVGWGTVPVGAAVGGWLGGLIGLRTVLALCAAGSLLTAAQPLFSAVRRIDQTPETEPVWGVLRTARPG